MGITSWIAATLRHYPEIAIFLTLALGYYFGKFTFKGIGLGSVTATLLAGVIIGQLGITISAPLKATVFLMFLFAVGYGVGPQFVRGVAKDGLPQALFAAVQCAFSLLVPVAVVKFVGYDLGYASGFYSGSQTISAAMGLSADAINRLGLAAHAHTPRDVDRALQPLGWRRTAWFGVRVFTDHRDEPAPEPGELAGLLAAEREAGGRDPYRSVAALLHLVYVRHQVRQVFRPNAIRSS